MSDKVLSSGEAAPTEMDDDSDFSSKLSDHFASASDSEDNYIPPRKSRRENKNRPKKKSTFECVMCTKTFSSVIERNFHHVSKHQDPVTKTFKCDQCPAQYTLPSNLKAHLVRHDKVICDICGKKFFNQYNLKTHRETCHFAETLKKELCQICSKEFNTPALLKSHLRRHANIRYKCPDCDKSYKEMVDLRSHRLKHDTTIPEFECDICGKKYFNLSSLKVHLNLHRGRDDYEEIRAAFRQKVQAYKQIEQNDEEQQFVAKFEEVIFESDKETPEFHTIDEIRFVYNMLSDVLTDARRLLKDRVNPVLLSQLNILSIPNISTINDVSEEEIDFVFIQLTSVVNGLKTIIGNKFGNLSFNSSIHIALPINHIAGLDFLEEKLQNRIFAAKFIEYIKCYIPQSNQNLSSGLACIMTDELTSQFNFEGSRGKKSFSDYRKFVHALFEAWKTYYGSIHKFFICIRKQINNANTRHQSKVRQQANLVTVDQE